MDATKKAPVCSLWMLPVMVSHATYAYLVRWVGVVDGAGMDFDICAIIFWSLRRASFNIRYGMLSDSDEA